MKLEKDCGFVWKIAKEKLGPIVVDLDLDLSEKMNTNDCQTLYLDVAETILGEFDNLMIESTQGDKPYADPVEIVMTRRPGLQYFKQKKKVFRAGFHLYILGKFSLEMSEKLRTRVLERWDLKKLFVDNLGDIVLSASSEIL